MRYTITALVLVTACLFVASVPTLSQAQIIIFDVEFLPHVGGSRAFGINEAGTYPLYVCGEAENAMGVWRPAVWSNDGVGGWVLEFLPGLAPGRSGRAWGVLTGPGGLGKPVACGYEYDALDRLRPVRWEKVNGSWSAIPLLTLNGNSGEALNFCVDSFFDIYYFSGYCTQILPAAADAEPASAMSEVRKAAVWLPVPAPDDLKVLPDYGPDREAVANAIDYDALDRLYAAGYAENLFGNKMAQVWLSANGGLQWTRVELPAPPGGAAWSMGSDVSAGGNEIRVVGRAEVAGMEHPVAWESLDNGINWTATDLGVPAGYASAVGFTGTTVGNLGSGGDFWVGAAADAQGVREAAYWYDDMGNIVSGRLTDLVGDAHPIHLSEARGIDLWGRVVGCGPEKPEPDTLRVQANAYAVADTDTVAFVLIPVSGTGVGDPPVPTLAARLEAKPNPFNPVVEIAFSVPAAGRARVTVYDAAGREVAELFDGTAGTGIRHTAQWRGVDRRGQAVGSGVYFVRLTGAGTNVTRKIVLLK